LLTMGTFINLDIAIPVLSTAVNNTSE